MVGICHACCENSVIDENSRNTIIARRLDGKGPVNIPASNDTHKLLVANSVDDNGKLLWDKGIPLTESMAGQSFGFFSSSIIIKNDANDGIIFWSWSGAVGGTVGVAYPGDSFTQNKERNGIYLMSLPAGISYRVTVS